MRRSLIVGIGAYLPERVVTNAELSKTIDTTDEWIASRTGIRQRHIAAADETSSDLALKASRKALAHAGLRADEVDLIIVATTTPDSTFPATAARLQGALEIDHGAAFDIQAVCAGFIFGLATADNFLRTGQANTALVVGAETFSRILDWHDRATCVLFGDGAGAVVLQGQTDAPNSNGRGILSCHLHSDGRLYDLLYVDGGVSTTQTAGHVRMQGPEVYRHAINKLSDTLEEALRCNGLTVAEVDWLVPHQANKRIIDGVAKKLGLPPEKVVLTVDRHANTSAASVPLALAEAVGDGRIKQGDVVLLEAIGGGLTWGSSVIRW